MLDTKKNILVIAAIQGELDAFIGPLKTKKAELWPFTYYIDELTAGNKVYCVLCGAGKVNSSSIVSAFISQRDFNIGLVINTGTAGALDDKLGKGDIVVGVNYCQHDYDITGLFSDFQVGQMIGKDNLLDTVPDYILDKLPRPEGVYFGTIISGDKFIDKAVGISGCKPLAVDMESAAVAHICYNLYNIPFLSVRVITDSADESAHEDWKSLHEELSFKAAEYSMDVIKSLYQADFKQWQRK
jgi:adenosylhomocysteine nucleosidase